MSSTYYHVAPQWDGTDLTSLRTQWAGDESAALDEFLARWPEAGELAPEHIGYVHLYADLADAQTHARDFGGEVLVIEDEEDELEIQIDHCEFAHPVSPYPIPAAYVRRAEPGGERPL